MKVKEDKHGLLHMFAGSIAGVTQKVILQPLDLVKTRLQVQDGKGKHEYRGIGHAIRTIMQREGAAGLYRGLTPNLIAAGTSWGVYFFTYNRFKEQAKSILRARHPNQEIHLGPLHNLLCAACSGICSTFVVNPISMIKTRMQLQGRDVTAATGRVYNGVFDAFRRIINEEGFLSLYRGIGPSLFLVSNGAIQFMCYEELKVFVTKYISKTSPNEELGTVHWLIMGALAKMISTTITYPMNVTRARLYQRKPDELVIQSSSSQSNTKKAPDGKYKNMFDCIKSIMKNEGYRGFYRGLTPQLLKTAPASAITFCVYETVMKIFSPVPPSSSASKASAESL